MPENRRKLKARFGLEIYEPHIAVVIGRSREFAGDVDKQGLLSSLPDLEIATYDEMLTYAKRRVIRRP